MESRKRAPPLSSLLKKSTSILAVALLFSLLGLAHALPPDPRLDQAGPPRKPGTLGSLAVILRKGVAVLMGPVKLIRKVVATRAALLFSAGAASWMLWKHFERERENEMLRKEQEAVKQAERGLEEGQRRGREHHQQQENKRKEEEEAAEKQKEEEEEAAEKQEEEERKREEEQKRMDEEEEEEEKRRKKDEEAAEQEENRQKKKEKNVRLSGLKP
jgi:flagellar biosynthesis GTPase FlhF